MCVKVFVGIILYLLVMIVMLILCMVVLIVYGDLEIFMLCEFLFGC